MQELGAGEWKSRKKSWIKILKGYTHMRWRKNMEGFTELPSGCVGCTFPSHTNIQLFFFALTQFFPHLLSLFLFSELFIWTLQMWQSWPLRKGRQASAYPTLAESDVPPSLPHRAETATTHAAQNLLISLSLHLRHRDMRDKMQGSGWGGLLHRGCRYLKEQGGLLQRHIELSQSSWRLMRRDTNIFHTPI